MLAIATAVAYAYTSPSTGIVRHVPKSGVGRQPWAHVRSAVGPSGWVWQHADWEGRTSGAAAALTLAQSRSSDAAALSTASLLLSQTPVFLNAAVLVSASLLLASLMLFVDHIPALQVCAEYQELLARYPYEPGTLTHLLVANWNAYEVSLLAHPVVTKTFIGAAIYAAGDWSAQVAAGAPPLQVDARRVLRSSAIGAAFGLPTHLYYEWSDAVLPPTDALSGLPAHVGEKILMDQTIYAATKYAAYLAAVGALAGRPAAAVADDVRTKLPSAVTTGWRFWPLAHLVTYNLVPPRHRQLWVNCADLVWVTLLATISAGDVDSADAEEEPPVADSRPVPAWARAEARSLLGAAP